MVAPLLAKFYHEPRLFWVTIVTGLGFIFTGASAQHRAVLQRELRFVTLTAIDLASLLSSIAVGIGMAWAGFGYWSLVGMALCIPMVGAVLVLALGRWIPSLPRGGGGVLSMMKYGGTVTLNSIIAYAAANMDKVLLGRFWGAEVLGIYGRAYQLINIPTDNLNATIGQVAFPALARVQNNPERLRSYFLKGYGLFLSLVLPITLACGLFAEDIVRLFLGPKWEAAVPVFRLLAPTILTFALVNPMAWLMMATGHAVRNLWITCAVTPLVIAGYVAGLRFGPTGVAAGFSTTAVLLVLPIIYFATRGTSIRAIDALKVIMQPLISILVASCAALVVANFTHSLPSTLARLLVDSTVLFGVYALMLYFVMGQKDIYLQVIREIGILQWFQRGKTRVAAEPAVG
jgi:O-antigen/teichoic acid export membrane protein